MRSAKSAFQGNGPTIRRGSAKLVIGLALVVAAVAVGAFGLSYALFALVNALIPMRVTSKQEERGLDDSQHGEQLH